MVLVTSDVAGLTDFPNLSNWANTGTVLGDRLSREGSFEG
jgi:hypothetical protein